MVRIAPATNFGSPETIDGAAPRSSRIYAEDRIRFLAERASFDSSKPWSGVRDDGGAHPGADVSVLGQRKP
jgi:hypothetical protein